MPDLHKTGEKKIYYRLKTNQHIDFNQFIHKLHHSNNGISEADAIRVLLSAADQLAEWSGKQVTATFPPIFRSSGSNNRYIRFIKSICQSG